MHKPFSQACENNREPILSILKPVFSGCRRILEIGSGTGQHAVFFAEQLPHLFWHTSDLPENHAGIKAWLADYAGSNLFPPLVLDMGKAHWEKDLSELSPVDGVFSANTSHIMSWPQVEQMLAGVGRLLPAGGIFALYGPFNYDGEYTSDSNAAFDTMLRQRDPASGLRDMDDILDTAEAASLFLIQDNEMPANNRLLVFGKRG